MRRFLSLLALLIPSIAFAGEHVEYRAGMLRAECMELRKWGEWHAFAEELIFQTLDIEDNDTVELDAECYTYLRLALIRWEVEKAKSPQQKNREALRDRIDSFLHRVEHHQDANGDWYVTRSIADTITNSLDLILRRYHATLP